MMYEGGFNIEEWKEKKLAERQETFAAQEEALKDARFFVIAVTTPLNGGNTPDLTAVKEATALVARHLSRGSIVVYESTVYPGGTEDICRPNLERESGFACGPDFKIGYSPERIIPGDRQHRLFNIVKNVSGMAGET